MKLENRITLVLVAFAMLTGCASTEVTQQQPLVTEKLPKPATIFVYDFIATSTDIPSESAMVGQYAEPAAPQSAEQVAAGRKLGADMAAQLVEEIRELGLTAARGSNASRPQVNDILIRGYLLSVQEGSTAARVTIGFGAGSSELRTAVEGFQVTASGLRKIGSGTVDAGGGKGPGAAVPAAVAIATANPVGLIVGGGLKIYGEASGNSRVEGRAEDTVDQIAERLEERFKELGWIE